MNDYTKAVLRTANLDLETSLEQRLSMGAMGLSGETGEVIDLIKKIVFHKKPLDKDKLVLELGDVFWYLEYLCLSLGINSEDVKTANIEKLNKRYPEGFTYEAANSKREEI